jgi:hypothetical protein
VIIVRTEDQAQQALDAGELVCSRPGCGGIFRRDGHARKRRVRTKSGAEQELRPQRVQCSRCDRVQVLLPAWCVPRRADDMETIGAALLHAALGLGYRGIAAMLDRPASTVRGWLRTARANAGRAGRYAYLTRRLMEPEEATLTRSAPHARTPLAYAVDDLGGAAAAARRHFGSHRQAGPPAAAAARRRFGSHRQAGPWAMLTAVGGFLLLAPARYQTEFPPAF